MRSEAFNYSGMYFYGGQVFTPDQIIAEGLDDGDSADSLKADGIDAIYTRFSNWRAFYKGKDIFIPIKKPTSTK